MIRALFLSMLAALPAGALTVDEILDKMEANEEARTSRMEATMVVYDVAGKERTSELISYGCDKGDKGLMEYVSPARIKGMKMLMLNDGDDIWVYFPRTARVRKIASHQKKQSVNNSDFSYEDLSMRDNRKDYHCTLAGEETKDGAACYKIVMKARDPEKTYQRIVMWVDKESFVSVAAEFFDEDGQLWKQLEVDDVTRIGDYWTARTIEMKDVQKGSRTVMKMDKIEYDIQLDESMFSERYLKK